MIKTFNKNIIFILLTLIELSVSIHPTTKVVGFLETNIVKDRIKKGGYFAAHDIYYPKSIKSFQIFKKIKNSSKWAVVCQSRRRWSEQGLVIARKRR